MACLQRNPEIIWRVEKRREKEELEALEAGNEGSDAGTVTLIQSGMMHQLNLVGGMVWERCDGNRSVVEIVDELAAEFDIARDELQVDVEAFISELGERGWLVDG